MYHSAINDYNKKIFTSLLLRRDCINNIFRIYFDEQKSTTWTLIPKKAGWNFNYGTMNLHELKNFNLIRSEKMFIYIYFIEPIYFLLILYVKTK